LDAVNNNLERNMGQRENTSKWLPPAEQAIQTPVAWRYMLGDGKSRYRRELCDGANRQNDSVRLGGAKPNHQ